MKKIFYFISLFLFVCIFSIPLYSQEEEITTVFLVRHAEKVKDNSNDPDLSSAGKERAIELAYILENVQFDAIYDTPYKRTRQTILPFAEKCNLTINTIKSLRANDLKEFVDRTLNKYKGGNILIASHSNIVPALIKLIRREDFDMRKIKYIDDHVYDDLFVVTFEKRENARVINLKYGKHTPVK